MGDALKYKLEIEKRPLPKVFVTCLLFSFCCCASLICGWKHNLDARGVQWKSQSSFYSSLGRAQAAHCHVGEYDTSFLGSSITGRIPGVESGFTSWANLGIDASSAVEGINLMLAGVTPATPYVVIETNQLFSGLPPVSKKPEKDFGDSPLYLLPCFTPLYRASTLLWTELRHETFSVDAAQPYSLAPLPTIERTPVRPQFWADDDARIMQALARLQKEKGVRVCLVVFPNRQRETNKYQLEKICYLAASLGVPYYDLNAQIAKDEPIEFSDAVHMRCKYALRVAATIYKILHEQ